MWLPQFIVNQQVMKNHYSFGDSTTKAKPKTLAKLDPELKAMVDSLHQDYYQAWQKSHYPRSDQNTMKQWYEDAWCVRRRRESVTIAVATP